jgi:hypothetical protein
MDHGFIRRHIEMQGLFVDTPEGPQVGTKRRPRPRTGVAMDPALAVTVVIARPFAHPVGNRGMARMATSITLPCIGIEPCARGGHVVGHEGVAGWPVRMVADPPALLACVARDDADHGGTIVGRGAVPFLLARRRGGSAGSRWGVLFFPRVLVQLVGLKSGAGHDIGRRGLIEVGLEALPQGMELLARQAQFAREARRGFALGHPAEQQHKGRWALPGFLEDGPGQQGVVAIAAPTAVGRKVALCTEQAPLGMPTARACQPVRVQVTFQPESADAIVQELGNRAITHAGMISQPARWLHMSHYICINL